MYLGVCCVHGSQGLEKGQTAARIGADRQDQRIDIDVPIGDACSAGGFHHFVDDRHSGIAGFRDSRRVHRQGDHTTTVPRHQGQDVFQQLRLAADRVDHWGFVDGLDRRGEGLGIGAIQAQRRIDRSLHSFDQPDQIIRLLLGMGAGQPSRIVSARIAKEKAGDKTKGSVLASDAMFPFPDVVEAAAEGGVTAIIQPGGSIRDEDSIKAADKHNIAMVFTGERHFRH